MNFLRAKLHAFRQKKIDDRDRIIQGLRENLDEYRHVLNVLHAKIHIIHETLQRHNLLNLFDDDEEMQEMFEISETVWKEYE